MLRDQKGGIRLRATVQEQINASYISSVAKCKMAYVRAILEGQITREEARVIAASASSEEKFAKFFPDEVVSAYISPTGDRLPGAQYDDKNGWHKVDLNDVDDILSSQKDYLRFIVLPKMASV